MSVTGAFFEVTGKMQELDRIYAGIEANEGRQSSSESMSLDLWLEMRDEWFRMRDAEVRALAAQGTEEPEWEYGVMAPSGRMVNNGDYRVQQTHRRRKAGPWEAVPAAENNEREEN